MRAALPQLDRRAVLLGLGAAAAGGCGDPTVRRADGAGVEPPPTPLWSRAAYPLSAPAARRHLVDAAGAPYFLHGDAAWSLIAQLDAADADAYLRDRAARGFNAILVNLLERRFAARAPANIEGEPPFTTPDDYATPNERYFAHADRILARAAELGILVLLTPSYIGWGGGDQGWYAAMLASDEATLRGYGRHLGERYRGFDNILWVHGGDYDPPNRNVVRAIAAGIRDADPHALHTAHGARGTSALDYWPGEDWLSVNSAYASADYVYEACAREHVRPEALPFFLIEADYEADRPEITEHTVRSAAWRAVLTGAFGHVYGDNPIWRFDGPGLAPAPAGWRESLGSRGAQSMTHLRTFMAQTPWPELAPDLEARFLIDGVGGGGDRAAAAVTADGSVALAYAPSSRRIEIDLSRLSGTTARLRWLDPSSGELIEIGVEPTARGAVAIQPRRRNGAGYSDWVLQAEASP